MAAASAKEKFTAAVNVIRTLPKDGNFQPSREMMLKFYGFYKQATCGPCTDLRPAFWDVVGKAKWEVWNDLHGMTEEEAMINYVEQLKQIVEAMPHSDTVQNFIAKLDSFYERVDEKTINGSSAKFVYKDTDMDMKALTEGPVIEGTPKRAVSVHSISAAEFGPRSRRSELNASRGDNGAASSDNSGDDIDLAMSIPQKALTSRDMTHLTNGNSTHRDDTSPKTNGDGRVQETGHNDTEDEVTGLDDTGQPHGDDTGTPHGDHTGTPHGDDTGTPHGDDTRSVTSQDSDTEVFCDTSDLPLELSLRLESPPGRELPCRELDISLTNYSITSPAPDFRDTHQAATASRGTHQVVVHSDPGIENRRNGNRTTSEHSRRHQPCPVMTSAACPMPYDALIQQLATRGGGAEQAEGSGSVPTSTPRARHVTTGSQQTGATHQQVPADRFATCSCGGAGGDRWSHDLVRSEVNEQIALTLLRLQQDMNGVIARVRMLESAAQQRDSGQQRLPWWPQALRGRGVLFAIVWPIIVHLVLTYLRRRCRRRR